MFKEFGVGHAVQGDDAWFGFVGGHGDDVVLEVFADGSVFDFAFDAGVFEDVWVADS